MGQKNKHQIIGDGPPQRRAKPIISLCKLYLRMRMVDRMGLCTTECTDHNRLARRRRRAEDGPLIGRPSLHRRGKVALVYCNCTLNLKLPLALTLVRARSNAFDRLKVRCRSELLCIFPMRLPSFSHSEGPRYCHRHPLSRLGRAAQKRCTVRVSVMKRQTVLSAVLSGVV